MIETEYQKPLIFIYLMVDSINLKYIKSGKKLISRNTKKLSAKSMQYVLRTWYSLLAFFNVIKSLFTFRRAC